MLEGLSCIILVDGEIYYGLDETDLLNTLELILERLKEIGVYAATHKCTFFETSITWCGKVHSQGQVKHDPERLTGLATMRRPETAVDLMQFAVNGLRTSLPRMAEVVRPLRVFLEEHLAGAKRRTKRVASNRTISAGEWTLGLIRTWEAAQDLAAYVFAANGRGCLSSSCVPRGASGGRQALHQTCGI